MTEQTSGLLVLPAPTPAPQHIGHPPALSSVTRFNVPSSTVANSCPKPPRSSPPPASTPTSAEAATRRTTPKYPRPLIVPPLGRKHKQTFIVLHGRGSMSKRFGPPLVELSIPQPSSPSSTPGSRSGSPTFNISNLQTCLPYTRFVFPGASLRQSTTFDDHPVTQWFDENPLEAPCENEHLMCEGLQDTTAYVHRLIEQEARLVGGPQNVILGGLSQGCAASLIAMLLWKGEPLRACVGMAGWLPFRERMESIARGERASWWKEDASCEGRDVSEAAAAAAPSERSDDEGKVDAVKAEGVTLPQQAIRLLREELSIPAEGIASLQRAVGGTPVFLGHGMEDEKVPLATGNEASSCLSALGFDVQHQEYSGLGHWYSGQMLGDIVGFLHDIDEKNAGAAAANTNKTGAESPRV